MPQWLFFFAPEEEEWHNRGTHVEGCIHSHEKLGFGWVRGVMKVIASDDAFLLSVPTQSGAKDT